MDTGADQCCFTIAKRSLADPQVGRRGQRRGGSGDASVSPPPRSGLVWVSLAIRPCITSPARGSFLPLVSVALGASCVPGSSPPEPRACPAGRLDNVGLGRRAHHRTGMRQVMRHELDEAGILLTAKPIRTRPGATEERERASIFSAAADALQAYSSEAALEAAKDPNFSPEQFVASED